MAIERVPGGLWIPTPIPWGAANPSFTNMTINASGEKAAFIIQVPKSGTLECFEFLTGTVSQSPVNGLKFSFQDVDLATGDPDGVADQYRVLAHPIGANTWHIPEAMTSDGTSGGTKRTVTRGELLACVVEFESFAASDSVNVRVLNLSANAFVGNTPYPTHFTAAWAKSNEGIVLALRYDDLTYGTVLGACYPFAAINSYVYNSDSLGVDEYGLAFSFSSDVRAGAFYVRANITANADFILYDKDLSTVLETMSLDTNVRTQSATQYHLARCSTDRMLYANETYILSLKPTTASDVTLYTNSLDSVDLGAALEGGTSWALANRLDGGAWLYNHGERPFMGVVVTGIDHDISGGSGGTGWEGDP